MHFERCMYILIFRCLRPSLPRLLLRFARVWGGGERPQHNTPNFDPVRGTVIDLIFTSRNGQRRTYVPRPRRLILYSPYK